MLLIQNLSLPIDASRQKLRSAAAQALRLPERSLPELTIRRQSIDARNKASVKCITSVSVSLDPDQERAILKRAPKGVSLLEEVPYRSPEPTYRPAHPPVVVGMGPAGLFAALTLARAGVPPILLERGRPVEERTRNVAAFWDGGPLDPCSNVQFGEGGAGTFSDGKLTTGIHDPRIRHVLETFVAHGAPEDILWSQKPHIGTDVLRSVIRSMREELLTLGAEIRFEHTLSALESKGGVLTGIRADTPTGPVRILCSDLILAPGHSARDTFQMLAEAELPLEQKPFAIGVRIEHWQDAVSAAQFGPAWEKLPPADYKLACHLPSGRSVFTFCVCPGGQVVAAASGPGQVVTNGMSLRARDGSNINGGLLVGVNPADFGGTDPLAGVRFQERWEHAAFAAGGASYRAPAQRSRDFLARKASSGPGSILPTYRPGVAWGTLDRVLPDYVLTSLAESIPLLDRKLHGFAAPDAVLTGVETRSSSPVRILRDSTYQSPALRGLFPCGEGAGYAGGITSAAVDGIRSAEALLCRA